MTASFEVGTGPASSSFNTVASSSVKVDVEGADHHMSRLSLADSPAEVATAVANQSPFIRVNEVSGIPITVQVLGSNADAAAGGMRAITINKAVSSGDNVGAAGAANLSDVPEVLRQHLDRRKAQLQSMQQRLAKLSSECDSLQGMMATDV
jgi:hypothetical protein